MTNVVKSGIVLTIFFTIALGQQSPLICYDCDPIQDPIEECKHPVANIGRSPVCQQTNTTVSYCISTYIQHTNANRSGIYRGCINKPLEVANLCDWFREEKTSANVTVKSCYFCNESRCNTVMLYADGSSSATNISSLQSLTLVNILLFVIFAIRG